MAKSVTTAEIAAVADSLGISIHGFRDEQERVVVKLLSTRGVTAVSRGVASQLLVKASEMLDDEYRGEYNVYDKVIRAVDLGLSRA